MQRQFHSRKAVRENSVLFHDYFIRVDLFRAIHVRRRISKRKRLRMEIFAETFALQFRGRIDRVICNKRF